MRQSKPPPLAVVESNRLPQHDLAPGRERGHVEPHIFERDSGVPSRSPSQRSPRLFRYFRISCKADTPSFYFRDGAPRKRSRIYAKGPISPGFPVLTGKGLDRQRSGIIRQETVCGARSRRWLGGFRGARAGFSRSASSLSSPAWPSRPDPSSLFSSFAGSRHLSESRA